MNKNFKIDVLTQIFSTNFSVQIINLNIQN